MISEPITTTERLAEFERALKCHDWYFDYSDDIASWRRGLDAKDRLEAMRRTLILTGAKAEVDALWSRYCPFGASA